MISVEGLAKRYAASPTRAASSWSPSHLMSEMQLIADRVVVVGRGRLIVDADVGDVLRDINGRNVLVRTPDCSKLFVDEVGACPTTR